MKGRVAPRPGSARLAGAGGVEGRGRSAAPRGGLGVDFVPRRGAFDAARGGGVVSGAGGLDAWPRAARGTEVGPEVNETREETGKG